MLKCILHSISQTAFSQPEHTLTHFVTQALNERSSNTIIADSLHQAGVTEMPPPLDVAAVAATSAVPY